MKELYEWLLEWWSFSRGWVMFTDYELDCEYYKQSKVVIDYDPSFNERCMNSIENDTSILWIRHVLLY